MKIDPPDLPLQKEIETKAILKQLVISHRALATLNGLLPTIPNENILLNTLTLQEAKNSSEIENIITTHDELYKAQITGELSRISPANKEVLYYREALHDSFIKISGNKLITGQVILNAHRILERNDAGYRTQSGTKLINERTGEIVYTPPQDKDSIIRLMTNLEKYINDDSLSDEDPLVKMAVMHHQFESIHPFYDGNGRMGRILNVLFLTQKNLLKLPILYLSRYFIQNKSEYYRLLQYTRTSKEWEPWLLYVLKGVEDTSNQTARLIERIKELMMDYKRRMREKLPTLYSQDLLNNLFKHPYTKIELVTNDLNVSRQTASKYLNRLSEMGFVKKHRVKNFHYYINEPLFNLLKDGVVTELSTGNIVTKTN